MATITINIPDNVVSDVINAFAEKFNWNSSMGITKAQFAKQQVALFVKNVYRERRIINDSNVLLNEISQQMDGVDIN